MTAEFNGTVFENTNVPIDGKSFDHCKFSNCGIVYKGGEPPQMQDCSFDERCRIVFEGPAANTLTFLQTLEDDPATRLVIKQTFPKVLPR